MSANHVLLQRVELTQTTTYVTINNIPQSGYTDLKIVLSLRDTRAIVGGGFGFSLNGDTPETNYVYRYLEGNGSAASAGTGTGTFPGNSNGNSATSNTYGITEIYIPEYLSSNGKTFIADSVTENNATSAYIEINSNVWSNAVPVKSMTFTASSFMAGSTFSVYGISSSETIAEQAPKAIGGDIVTNDGEYWYHAFLTTGTFKPQTSLPCDVMVVAGGAAGAGIGGGGGAGGLIPYTRRTFGANTSYVAVVGSGGAAPLPYYSGNSGSNSSIADLLAYGGGGAGSWQATGLDGGSGGGSGSGGSGSRPGGNGTSGQGNAGGGGWAGDGTHIDGGGGGGYSSAGVTSSYAVGGNGGAGYTLGTSEQIILGYPVLSSGGGGSSRNTPGTGGTGAGNGSNNNNVAGSATSFGSGGGGSGQSSGGGSFNTAGAGAGGVILIRYAMG